MGGAPNIHIDFDTVKLTKFGVNTTLSLKLIFPTQTVHVHVYMEIRAGLI